MTTNMPMTRAHSASLQALAALRADHDADDKRYSQAMQTVRALEGVTAELERHEAERIQRQADASIVGKPFDTRDPLGDQLRARKADLAALAPVQTAVAEQLLARIRAREQQMAAMRPTMIATGSAALAEGVAAMYLPVSEALQDFIEVYVEAAARAAACDALQPHGSRVPPMASQYLRRIPIAMPDIEAFRPLASVIDLSARVDARKAQILAYLGLPQ